MRRLLALCLAVLLAGPAFALVVDGEDDELQRRPPKRDPGWAHVGRRGRTSAIYLGDGWVLTARHAGFGDVVFDAVTYPALPGSWIQLDALGGDGAKADLVLFRIDPAPNLPALPLGEKSPAFASRVLLIGYGRGRSEPLEWQGIPGFRWGPESVKRWGTNRVYSNDLDIAGPNSITRCFQMDFSHHGTVHEAQATTGDSGGAVFAKRGGEWRLAGVLLSIGSVPGQHFHTSLYGNTTNAADLSYYRRQILRIMKGAGSVAEQARSN
jgi:hypothetical protein